MRGDAVAERRECAVVDPRQQHVQRRRVAASDAQRVGKQVETFLDVQAGR